MDEDFAYLLLQAKYHMALTGRGNSFFEDDFGSQYYSALYPVKWYALNQLDKINILKEAVDKKIKIIDTQLYHKAVCDLVFDE